MQNLGNRLRFLGSAMGIAIANHNNRCDFSALSFGKSPETNLNIIFMPALESRPPATAIPSNSLFPGNLFPWAFFIALYRPWEPPTWKIPHNLQKSPFWPPHSRMITYILYSKSVLTKWGLL